MKIDISNLKLIPILDEHVTKEMIDQAIQMQDFRKSSFQENIDKQFDPNEHARRIAFIVDQKINGPILLYKDGKSYADGGHTIRAMRHRGLSDVEAIIIEVEMLPQNTLDQLWKERTKRGNFQDALRTLNIPFKE